MDWQSAVLSAISRLAERKSDNLFDRNLLIQEELDRIIKDTNSVGRTPEQTLSKILQQLRNSGEIEFLGKGKYQLLDSRIHPSSSEAQDLSPAKRERIFHNRIVRDAKQARELKRRYRFHCQICECRLELKAGFYCEAHHIRPLGQPHNGPDTECNIIIVCPNHHTLLDFAAVPINLKALKLNRHEIEPEFVKFHNMELFENRRQQ